MPELEDGLAAFDAWWSSGVRGIPSMQGWLRHSYLEGYACGLAAQHVLEVEMPALDDAFDVWFNQMGRPRSEWNASYRGYVAGYHAREVAAQQLAEADGIGRLKQAEAEIKVLRDALAALAG